MRGRPLDVLLVEPYFRGSHRAWAEGYRRHSEHRVRLITHDGSFWRWRLRGAALTLARAIDASVVAHGRPDVVLVSDMVNVAALLGLSRRSLGDIPVALYLHESQLLYPPPPARGRRPARRTTTDPEEAALINWISMAAVDVILVNSLFHLESLRQELPRLLKRAPDQAHDGSLADVVHRMSVLPVGVELSELLTADGRRGFPPLVVWNQRWEHDKDPETFFGALLALADEDLEFHVALAGENVRIDPQEFERAGDRLGERVVHVGHLPGDRYRELLTRADVVVSTARHEFFGIAVVEAMAAGAVPLLPDRLSYPELVPEPFRAAVLYQDPDLRDRLRDVLTDIDRARRRVEGLRRAMASYSWEAMAPRYDDRLSELVDAGGGTVERHERH